ncbi:uncharacterized protein HKW66_Vig0121980 [Vigna angularis]|uniref:Uncharacterized protein n=1 Tax=Phaseolus angularis TaxID=3914 RepID=A0A8T0JWY9_PHAAN|nr:uncharacterized protein HKW66_Vig0121980 [Vigna angularis]
MENMKMNKDERFAQKGVPIHSQVMKIKQESEEIVDWSPGKPEIRHVLREISRQISRSPLGISGQPISVAANEVFQFVADPFVHNFIDFDLNTRVDFSAPPIYDDYNDTIVDFNVDFHTSAHTQCIAAEVDTIAHSNIEFTRADSYIDIPVGACFDFAVYDFESVHTKFYVVDHMCYDLMKPIADTF